MKQKIFSLVMAVMMFFTISGNAFAKVTGNYDDASDMVKITGAMTAADEGKTVSMMLLDIQNDEIAAIEYVNLAKVQSDGSYEFNFRLSDKTVTQVKNYTLRVNEGSNDVTNTVLTVVVNNSNIHINIGTAETVGVTESKYHNQRVYVKGYLGSEYYGETVSMMLVNPDASIGNEIGYVNATTVDADGEYEFRFSFTGDLSLYYIKVNKAGEEVSDSVVEAVGAADKLYMVDGVITESGTKATYKNEIINPYGLDLSEISAEFTQILAYYDAEGKLLGIDSRDIDENTEYTQKGEDIEYIFEGNTIPEGAVTVKAMLWNGYETMIPVIGIEKVKAGERIVCWGDSLTEGAGSGSPEEYTGGERRNYPLVLSELTGKEVLNYGIGGDTAKGIASRQGGYELTLVSDVTIPADTDTIFEADLMDINGDTDYPDVHGSLAYFSGIRNKGFSPVLINGVECVIASEGNTSNAELYKFRRATAGEEVIALAGTPVIPIGAQSTYDDINIIFIGQNGGYPDGEGTTTAERAANGLISVIDSMIAKLNNDKYIVIGLTTSQRKYLEPYMQAHYGAKYINMREWLSSEEALNDAELDIADQLTDEDREQMENGEVPKLIRADDVHLNAYGYKLFADRVYAKLLELEYIK